MIDRLKLHRLAAGLAITLVFAGAAMAKNNWPQFRGPQADGVASDHAGLPTTWTTTDNVQWVADVPGWGWSCPIVWGDKVFLTTVVSDEENRTPSKGLYLGQGVRDPAKGVHHWLVYCFDLNSGKQLWKHEAHAGRPQVPRHPKSTYATETPATDGERLYVLFGDLGLYCYDLEGSPLWSRKIEPKKTFFDYGAAASPVVHDGQVIVVYDNREESWIASFDAKTGDQRWRTPRDETHSWATPFVWQHDARTEIVVAGQRRNRSYSLDGKLLWDFDGAMSSLVIPSPFAAHGMCYIASGYVGDRHRPTFAVKPGATGDLAPDGNFEDNQFIGWYDGKSSSYNPSQIVYGDYLHTLYDRGFLTCHDAKTGKLVYDKQRFTPSGSFTSSPWAYNGKLFFLSEDGLTYVVKAGPEFEIVGRNQLDELCLSSPAIAGDKLLIRTASKLYCLTDGAKLDGAKRDGAKRDAAKRDAAKRDAAKRDDAKADAAKADGSPQRRRDPPEADNQGESKNAEDKNREGPQPQAQAVAPADVDYHTADIISEGTRMAAEVFAPKSAAGKLPTILMSHGWGGTARALRPDAIAFARAGFLVVMKKLVVVKGIKHYGIYGEKRTEAQQLAIDWFAEHLQKESSQE